MAKHVETAAAADWNVWAHRRDAELHELVALSLDREPGQKSAVYGEEFTRRLKISASHLDYRHGGRFPFHEFADLADRIGWPLPKGFPKTALSGAAQLADGGQWPWGSHSTNLLRHLAAAGDKFWRNYDASDPTTAPTNQDVKQWLVTRGVSQRMAEKMATLLRADGLKTGPRRGITNG